MHIDLHAHSTASDGTTSPAELVTAAAAAGLDVLAITDHDTTAGWAPAAEALPAGLRLVRGAELSCRHVDAAGTSIGLHLLAYLFDPAEPVLRAERARIRDSRDRRGQAMVAMLQESGYDVTWTEVLATAAGGTVGRPHLADALVDKRIVADRDTALGPGWVGPGGRFWAPKDETDVLAAIGLVREAGGVPVLAHPRRPSTRGHVDDAAIAEMQQAGLAGLEVDHDNHTAADRAHLRALAADLGLLVTGSSDFHGTRKQVALGAYLTDPAVYEQIVAQGTGCGVLTG